MAVRINLSSAGVWWALFSLIPLAAIRNRAPGRKRGPGEGMSKTFREFAVTLRDMRHYPQTLRFLVAYLLYNDAVQAVIALSAQFGSDELKISMHGSDRRDPHGPVRRVLRIFSVRLDRQWIGAKHAVIVSLLIWTGVLVSMYVSVRNEKQFFIVAAIVGDRAGWHAGAQPVAILVDDSQGARSRIFRRV